MRLTDEQLQVIRDWVVAIDDDAMSQWQWCAVSLLGEVEALRALQRENAELRAHAEAAETRRDRAIASRQAEHDAAHRYFVAMRAAEARIAAALALPPQGFPTKDARWCEGYNVARETFRAALAEPVEPQPSKREAIAERLRSHYLDPTMPAP